MRERWKRKTTRKSKVGRKTVRKVRSEANEKRKKTKQSEAKVALFFFEPGKTISSYFLEFYKNL